nr:hypothetical protein Q903MT_gene1804 [Picea sitchensis]
MLSSFPMIQSTTCFPVQSVRQSICHSLERTHHSHHLFSRQMTLLLFSRRKRWRHRLWWSTRTMSPSCPTSSSSSVHGWPSTHGHTISNLNQLQKRSKLNIIDRINK